MIRWILALALATGQSADPSPVGMYDGGGFEMAAGLQLMEGGRFRYGMTVGALDESAEGTWRIVDGRVLLTSDPVTPPEFALVSQAPGEPGKLSVALDVPRGVNRQYFDVRLDDGDGEDEQQMGSDGLETDLTGALPVRVSVTLGMFGLASPAVTVDPAKGARLTFRFAPNDIGKVDFRDAELRREGDRYLLERAGGTMRFRRVAEKPTDPS